MFLILYVIQLLILVIFVDALLSWFPRIDRRNPFVVLLRSITTPIYKPIRQLIPPEKTGYIDLSPIIAIIALQLIGSFLQSLFH